MGLSNAKKQEREQLQSLSRREWEAERERRTDRYAKALTAANDAIAALPRDQRSDVAAKLLDDAATIIRGGLRAELTAENPFSRADAA